MKTDEKTQRSYSILFGACLGKSRYIQDLLSSHSFGYLDYIHFMHSPNVRLLLYKSRLFSCIYCLSTTVKILGWLILVGKQYFVPTSDQQEINKIFATDLQTVGRCSCWEMKTHIIFGHMYLCYTTSINCCKSPGPVSNINTQASTIKCKQWQLKNLNKSLGF